MALLRFPPRVLRPFCAVLPPVRALQATSNYEMVVPMDDTVLGIMPRTAAVYSFDLTAVPWLKQDVFGRRHV